MAPLRSRPPRGPRKSTTDGPRSTTPLPTGLFYFDHDLDGLALPPFTGAELRTALNIGDDVRLGLDSAGAPKENLFRPARPVRACRRAVGAVREMPGGRQSTKNGAAQMLLDPSILNLEVVWCEIVRA